MKRAALWFLVYLVIALMASLFYPDPMAKTLFYTLGAIWLCIGVAWGARGVVRYLRR